MHCEKEKRSGSTCQSKIAKLLEPRSSVFVKRVLVFLCAVASPVNLPSDHATIDLPRHLLYPVAMCMEQAGFASILWPLLCVRGCDRQENVS
jgi:hypothetical protein